MLSPSAETFRLFLHIISAAIWVGGQFVVAGIVPGMRRTHPEALKTLAQGFGRVAWPAFGILMITGMWSMMEVDITNMPSAYQTTLLLKIAFAIAAGVAAAIHAAGKSKVAMAVGGALGALCSVAALFLGILLGTGSA
jgi:putative copper export protein